MSDSFFMYSPGAFWWQQVCTCKNSRMVDEMRVEDPKVEGDKFTAQVVTEISKCSVCGAPYKMMVDTSKVVMVKNVNLGDEK
jgi:hypothetical protein